MPVLVWLAAGLSGSGLPPAAKRQAHEMACVLLGVVLQATPQSLLEKLFGGDSSCTQKVQDKASRLLVQLGPDIGGLVTSNPHSSLSVMVMVTLACFPKAPMTQLWFTSTCAVCPPCHIANCICCIPRAACACFVNCQSICSLTHATLPCAALVCKQLALVATALVAALFPKAATASSRGSQTTSSSEPPPLQQWASQAQAWRVMSALLAAALLAKGEVGAWCSLCHPINL
jgi:hypothetical protein